VALLFLAPFAYLLVRSVEGGGGLFDALTSLKALASLGRSVALGGAVSLASTIVGVTTAWLVTRTDVPGRRVWRLLLPLPLVIPSYIGAFVMLAAFAQGGLLEVLLGPLGVGEITAFGGFTGSFLVLTLFTFPYVYLPVQARLRQLPPSF
jgi:iron(III) transport system permease protein